MDYASQLQEEMCASISDSTASIVTHAGRAIKPTAPGAEQPKEGSDTASLGADDAAELMARLQRLKRVLRIISSGTTAPLSRQHDATLSERAEDEDQWEGPVDASTYRATAANTALRLTMLRLQKVRANFHGAEACAVSTTTGGDDRIQHAAVRPMARSISLAEGAWAAYGKNVGVVFRRRAEGGSGAAREKRQREEGTVVAGASSPALHICASLSQVQRKERFRVYTLRSALLPRVDAVCAPLFISPAIQELARLNSAAESAMAERAWRVSTRAQLLREFPSVVEDVVTHRRGLHEIVRDIPDAHRDALLLEKSYFCFSSTDEGVLRVSIQHGLILDLTYNNRQRRWCLLALHWNIWTTESAAALCSSSAVAEIDRDRLSSIPGEERDWLSCHTRVDPGQQSAMLGFLCKELETGGLSGGLRAANRLLCTVVMDLLAAQLRSLQTTFFVDALQAAAAVEVRAGTFISCRLTPSLLIGRPGPIDAAAVHLKISIGGGTVLLERMEGTDLLTRRVTALLSHSTCPIGSSPLCCLVVDMESWLWSSITAA